MRPERRTTSQKIAHILAMEVAHEEELFRAVPDSHAFLVQPHSPGFLHHNQR